MRRCCTRAGIIRAMRRVRWLMFAIAIVLFLACVRIRYQTLGWVDTGARILSHPGDDRAM